MSLANIKTKNQGFTIVELLIVVVVIAILAAITIVSYAGITARANESAVKLQASNFAKKAEAYNAEIGYYPDAMSDLSDATKSYAWTDSTNVTYGTTATTANLPNDSSVTKRLIVQKCGSGSPTAQSAITGSSVIGLKINYYNPNTKVVEFATAGTTSGTGIACPAA